MKCLWVARPSHCDLLNVVEHELQQCELSQNVVKIFWSLTSYAVKCHQRNLENYALTSREYVSRSVMPSSIETSTDPGAVIKMPPLTNTHMLTA